MFGIKIACLNFKSRLFLNRFVGQHRCSPVQDATAAQFPAPSSPNPISTRHTDAAEAAARGSIRFLSKATSAHRCPWSFPRIRKKYGCEFRILCVGIARYQNLVFAKKNFQQKSFTSVQPKWNFGFVFERA